MTSCISTFKIKFIRNEGWKVHSKMEEVNMGKFLEFWGK